MADSLLYKLRSGKPSKLLYYITNIFRMSVPMSFYRGKLERTIASLQNHPEKEYIEKRVNYYNKLSKVTPLPDKSIHERFPSCIIFLDKLKNFTIRTFHRVYYFDLKEYTRWFNQNFRFGYVPGDVYFTPEVPSIVKSRLLTDTNENSVVLKLDKLRHFMYVNDPVSYTEKKNIAIFRGKIRMSRDRRRFIEMFFDHPMFDCGLVGHADPDEWKTPKKTIRDHLDYKFIMTLEGNDVASNLKWVMSSNSIAVMPRPTCETWFMEGTLIPDYHYIEVKPDFSDMVEKLEYYIKHTDEAQKIIDQAHEYIAQFKNKERESLISLLVLDKYFRLTGQKD